MKLTEFNSTVVQSVQPAARAQEIRYKRSPDGRSLGAAVAGGALKADGTRLCVAEDAQGVEQAVVLDLAAKQLLLTWREEVVLS